MSTETKKKDDLSLFKKRLREKLERAKRNSTPFKGTLNGKGLCCSSSTKTEQPSELEREQEARSGNTLETILRERVRRSSTPFKGTLTGKGTFSTHSTGAN